MARADAARNAEALLAAARALFDERGTDVPLDEVARRAGVGNATLYRHFPTRADLLVAVYADDVAALCQTDVDLFAWLDRFVVHVASKRALALAATEGPAERRTALFDRWHASMRAAVVELLTRAHAAGTVHIDVTVDDVLALASGIAMVSADPRQARRRLRLLRHGLGQAP
jgi:AcrR family transcriptional regulator